jgi:hypothetical protein
MIVSGPGRRETQLGSMQSVQCTQQLCTDLVHESKSTRQDAPPALSPFQSNTSAWLRPGTMTASETLMPPDGMIPNHHQTQQQHTVTSWGPHRHNACVTLKVDPAENLDDKQHTDRCDQTLGTYGGVLAPLTPTEICKMVKTP